MGNPRTAIQSNGTQIGPEYTDETLGIPGAPIFGIEHPQRYSLTNELHARPFEMLTPPVRASMYATMLGEDGSAASHDHLVHLCTRYGINPPSADMSYFSVDSGPFRLRFEQHTEFASYTVIRHGKFAAPFDKPASGLLPRDWLESLPGRVLVATHVAVLPIMGDDPTT